MTRWGGPDHGVRAGGIRRALAPYRDVRDQGSATVIVVALIAVLWFVAAAATAVLVAVSARHRAQAAADLAALAAASSGSCAAAPAVATANDAHLTRCTTDGSAWVVEVDVVARLARVWRGLPDATVHATARAG